MKKGGGANAATSSANNAQSEVSEAQGGVKFELVGVPECMNENLAAS